MRDMMAQIRDVGDGIRGGTYTMTAPIITGGTINGATIGATTASTGKFTAVTNSALTSGRVTYAGTAGVLQDDADFTFNGTTVTIANDAVISGLTVGKGTGSAAGTTVVGNGAVAATNTGDNLTAVGAVALAANTSGTQNSAFGRQALQQNTTGSYNTALGHTASYGNTTGSNNVSVGRDALFSNTTADNNTAVGYQAGYSTTTGGGSTFIGRFSGYSTTGIDNIFVGVTSGYYVTTGTKNTILGAYNGNQGSLDIRTASNHIVLSDGDGNPRAYWNGTGQATFTATSGTGLSVTNNYTGNGTPLILTQSATNTFNACEIRNSSATAVFIVAANGNATNTNNSYGGISDAKLKENIVDATPKLDKLMQVKVRNYNLKGDDLKQIGVVAQELEQVFPSLIEETIDKDADDNNLETTTKSVKYSVFVPMLIKAVQELKAEVDSLKQQLGN
jgi:hypothetical protein